MQPLACRVERPLGWEVPANLGVSPRGSESMSAASLRFTSGFSSFSLLALQLPQLRKSSEVMESWGYAPSQGLGRMAAKT